jgi:hypothetical protein
VPQPTTLIGQSGLPAQVDPTHQALRASIRPTDFGLLGSYSIAALTGIEAATAAANSPIFTFRWAPVDPTKIALVRRLRFTAGTLGTAFTAGGVTIAAFVCRSFTVIDTGGTALTTSGNNCKRRSSMAPSALTAGSVLITTTGVLTAGTRTKDANAFATITTAITAVAGTPIVPLPGLLYDPTEVGHYPLVLANNEGITIEVTVPATGTWTAAVDMDWDEIGAY